MNQALASAEPVHNYCSGTQPGILSEIYQPELNLVYWQRETDVQALEYAQYLAGPDCYFSSKSSVLGEAEVVGWLNEVLPEHSGKAAFVEDVAMLADMFSCLFDLSNVGIRLQSLQRAMCPKFHVDKVPCRLVTTYTGATTEWLENSTVDRSGLGAGSRADKAKVPNEQSGLVYTEADIKRVPEQSVVLLKGEGWWQNEGNGIVHRSPQASASEPRVFLSFDFAN